MNVYQVLITHTLPGTDPGLVYGERLYTQMTSHVFNDYEPARKCFENFRELYAGPLFPAITVEFNTLEVEDAPADS